jgi:hypothetical protein
MPSCDRSSLRSLDVLPSCNQVFRRPTLHMSPRRRRYPSGENGQTRSEGKAVTAHTPEALSPPLLSGMYSPRGTERGLGVCMRVEVRRRAGGRACIAAIVGNGRPFWSDRKRRRCKLSKWARPMYGFSSNQRQDRFKTPDLFLWYGEIISRENGEVSQLPWDDCSLFPLFA